MFDNPTMVTYDERGNDYIYPRNTSTPEVDGYTGADQGDRFKTMPIQQEEGQLTNGGYYNNQPMISPYQAVDLDMPSPTVHPEPKEEDQVDTYSFDLAQAEEQARGRNNFPYDPVSDFDNPEDVSKEVFKSIGTGLFTLIGGLSMGAGDDDELMASAAQQALGMAGSMFASNALKSERAKQRSYFQAEGMEDTDIQAYERSGNFEDLTINKRANRFKGKPLTEMYFSKGNQVGRKQDGTQLTAKEAGTYTREQKPDGTFGPWQFKERETETVNLGNKIVTRDKKTGETVRTDAVGENPNVNRSSASSRNADGSFDAIQMSDGTAINTPGRYKLKNGEQVDVQVSSRGKLYTTKVSESDRAAYDRQETAPQTLVQQSIGRLMNADDTDLSSVTNIALGGASDFPELTGDIQSRFSDPKQRQMYLDARTLDGQLTKMGVGEARAMGASGINTIAEVQMYKQGMPELDYSSPEALRSSLGQLQSYTDSYNSQLLRSKGVIVGENANSEPTVVESRTINGVQWERLSNGKFRKVS